MRRHTRPDTPGPTARGSGDQAGHDGTGGRREAGQPAQGAVVHVIPPGCRQGQAATRWDTYSSDSGTYHRVSGWVDGSTQTRMTTRVVGSRDSSSVGTHPGPGLAAWACPRLRGRRTEPGPPARGPTICGRSATARAASSAYSAARTRPTLRF